MRATFLVRGVDVVIGLADSHSRAPLIIPHLRFTSFGAVSPRIFTRFTKRKTRAKRSFRRRQLARALLPLPFANSPGPPSPRSAISGMRPSTHTGAA